MNLTKTLLILSLCAAIINAKQKKFLNDWDDSGDQDESSDQEDDDVKQERQELRGESEAVLNKRVFDCKQKYEPCSGIVACCGTLQCFWTDGYSLTKSGRCVECVQRAQKCQRDAQCCAGMVCHKGSRYYVDGQCGERRYTGQECHEDSQCRSGSCQTTVGQKIKGYGGVCS